MSLDPNRYPQEHRLATVLFADIQGFTSLAEQLDSETLSDLINGIWRELDQVIEIHNGYIDKHLGDGVMAVWGAPFAGDSDAAQAVAAGLDLIKALGEYSKTTSVPGAAHMKLRVGINSGMVFAGYVGNRREYTVIGDAVNVASRLQNIAEPNNLVISEETLRLLQNNFRVRKIDPVQVKGRTELIQPYAVEGRLVTSMRIRYQGAESLQTNMVGREEELQKLREHYNAAFSHLQQPALVLLSGEVGMGKSRLLMEFNRELEASSEPITILSSRGLAQASRIPFYLWRTLLRSRPEGEEPEIYPKDLTPISKIEATEVLAAMIKFAAENTVTLQQTEQISRLARRLLLQMSQKKKLVILLDDLQWIDRESLQILKDLLQQPEISLQMFIVAATRTEFLQAHTEWHNLGRVIPLGALSLNAKMVAEAYPQLQNIPQAILQEIALRGEGNPYFVEEIAKNILKAPPPPANDNPTEHYAQIINQLPASLRATLQARLDSLSREARTVALLASVVGRVFWVGAVIAAAKSLPLPGANPMFNIPDLVADRFIQDGLRQLNRAEIAFPRTGSKYSEEQEYIFKNSYLRDVAYSLIPNRNRAQYHKAIADWMRQNADLGYQNMAREHEKNALQAIKISTGSLPPLQKD